MPPSPSSLCKTPEVNIGTLYYFITCFEIFYLTQHTDAGSDYDDIFLFLAQTLDLINYRIKYYMKDWALDEGRTAGFATPRDGSLLVYIVYLVLL